VFYRQFAFTLATAILISAVNALTLSPALCALFLRNNQHEQRKGFAGRFFTAFNTGFRAMTQRYLSSLRFLFRRRWIPVAALVALAASSYLMMEHTPTGFIPTEDQGFLLYAMQTPPGSSLAQTHKAMKEIDSIIKADPITDRRYNIEGLNFISNANASPYGAGFVRMKPIDQRGPVKDINAITASMTMKVANGVKDAHAFFFTFPTIQGFGNVAGFEFMLQDQTNGSLDKLGGMAYKLIGALMQRKEIAYAFTTFASGNPQYMMEVDNDKAKQLNVSISDLMRTMQIYYGSSFVSDFNRFGKYYRVMAQADVPYRANEKSLAGIYVKSQTGMMVPVDQLITLKRVYGPETVSRNNLYNAVTINGVPKPGYSTGDAIKAIEETTAQILPRGYAVEWTGMTREEKASGSQIIFIFILSLVFVYFLLSAQYESYILPFAIVLSIPVGVFGVFAFLKLFGVDNNIYVQVSLIMLVGLLAKNAILIVEYAVRRRKAGMELMAAALEAAQLRLRPILMTSFAFIAGLLPLMRAEGASALGNRSIGTGAVGGMLTGVILGVFVVPVLFVIFQHLQERFANRGSARVRVQPVPALSVVALVLLVGLGSCKVSKDVSVPAAPVPAQFRSADAVANNSDTAGVGSLPWKTFFTDPVLQRLIDSAIVRNYDMQVALENIRSAQLVLGQAKLGYWPDVTLAVTANLTRPSDNSLNGISAQAFLHSHWLNDYNAAVGLSWEADIWGKIRNEKSKALAQYLQTSEARKALQTNIVSGVAEGYYNLLMLDAQLQIARANLALNDSTLRIIRLQFNSGDVTALGVQQAEAQEMAAAELIPQLQQSKQLQENALSILTGTLPDAVVLGRRLEEVPVRDSLSTGVPAALLARRPDVRSSELALTVANANVGINKASMYPSIVISPEGGWDTYILRNWFNIPGSLFGAVVGGLTQPVFQRKKLKTQYQIALVDRDKAVIQFKESVLTAVGEVSDALAKIGKLKEQGAVASARVNTLQQAINNANSLFANGMANYLEVITAQSNVLQSELELASIKKGQLSAEVELYRSLGGGWN
jgi:NodT family efflux transporter outer membrane factor (OMF) lipoprotein